MNLRILLLATSLFVNVFADQSQAVIYNDVNRWNDDVEFMSQELLIPVKTKTLTKSKPVKVTEPQKVHFDQSENVQSNPIYQRQDSLSSLEKESIIISQKPVITGNPAKPLSVSHHSEVVSPPSRVSAPPCSDTDVDCLLLEEQLVNQHNKPESMSTGSKTADIQHNVGDRSLLQIEEDSVEASDEDILGTISDESINRYRRQSGPEDGGSGQGYFQETVDTTENPEFEITMTISLRRSVKSFKASDKQLYKFAFLNMLKSRFKFIPGFKRIEVKEIILNRNNKPMARFSIILDGSAIGALGSTPESRLQSLTGTIRNAPDVLENAEVLGNEVNVTTYQVDEFIRTVEFKVADVCESIQPCNPGYVCKRGKTSVGSYKGECTHACYSSKLNELCQNNAVCTLDASSKPYCQCGSLHTGVFCENEAPTAPETLSTAEVVGITVGTLVALAALASCAFFMLFCRKKKEKDMEYSYYGDDDNLMQGYVDQSSSLGISNMYIDRPRVAIQPLDIYNDQTFGTAA